MAIQAIPDEIRPGAPSPPTNVKPKKLDVEGDKRSSNEDLPLETPVKRSPKPPIKLAGPKKLGYKKLIPRPAPSTPPPRPKNPAPKGPESMVMYRTVEEATAARGVLFQIPEPPPKPRPKPSKKPAEVQTLIPKKKVPLGRPVKPIPPKVPPRIIKKAILKSTVKPPKSMSEIIKTVPKIVKKPSAPKAQLAIKKRVEEKIKDKRVIKAAKKEAIRNVAHPEKPEDNVIIKTTTTTTKPGKPKEKVVVTKTTTTTKPSKPKEKVIARAVRKIEARKRAAPRRPHREESKPIKTFPTVKAITKPAPRKPPAKPVVKRVTHRRALVAPIRKTKPREPISKRGGSRMRRRKPPTRIIPAPPPTPSTAATVLKAAPKRRVRKPSLHHQTRRVPKRPVRRRVTSPIPRPKHTRRRRVVVSKPPTSINRLQKQLTKATSQRKQSKAPIKRTVSPPKKKVRRTTKPRRRTTRSRRG